LSLKTAFNRAARGAPREADLFLMRAIARNDNTVAADLIYQGADVNYRNKKGETPLMAAAYEGNAAIMKILLEQGSDVNAVDADGNTAMHWLVKSEWTRGTPDMAQLLIDGGADTGIKNTFGETAEFLAGQWNKERLARRLRQTRKDPDAIEVVKPIRLKTAPPPEPVPEPAPVAEKPAAPPAAKMEKSETISEMERRFAKAGLFG
jgi:hypothetical protein